jgi:arylsulfatase A-like enzyme/Flp pilus assembly protein TadD
MRRGAKQGDVRVNTMKIGSVLKLNRTSWRRLALVVLTLVAATACTREQRWNVLVVSFDTTRADHLACYGHTRARTPNVDRLAANGTRFGSAYTAVPITAPSHSTIFTGTYPVYHGVRDNGIFVLAERNQTLAEILSEAGYATAAAVGSFPVTSKFGLDQGFDFFDDRVAQLGQDFLGERSLPKTRLYFDERPAGLVNEAILPWLREHHEEPFFVWAHYFDPHQPFEPPPPYDQLFASDPYLGEIAYADECLGVILDELETLGVADRTVVVFVSDHGEGLGDHNESTHSVLTYNSTLRVPLVIRIPGGAERVIDTRVGTVDIVPTVLDLLGMEIPDVVQGTSRAVDVRGTGVTPPGVLYAETLSPRISQGWGELRVIFDDDLKFIFGPRPELYDLAEDPNEYFDLIAERPNDAERLMADLQRFIEDNAAEDLEDAVEMDEATREQLAALGYLHTTTGNDVEIDERLRGDGDPPQDRVGDINNLSLAKQLIFSKRSLAAHHAAMELLDGDPSNPAYLELLAMAELQLGRFDETLAVLRRMEDFVQDGEVTRRLMIQVGTVFLFQGNADTALEMAGRAIEIDATADAFFLEAMAYSSLDRRDDELIALEAALVADSDFVAARINLAIRQAAAGDREAAGLNFGRAIRTQPYNPRAAFNYGAFLVESGDYEGAADRFERAVTLAPQYLKAQVALAAVASDLGRWERVREISRFLDARVPESGEAATVRGFIEEAS